MVSAKTEEFQGTSPMQQFQDSTQDLGLMVTEYEVKNGDAFECDDADVASTRR